MLAFIVFKLYPVLRLTSFACLWTGLTEGTLHRKLTSLECNHNMLSDNLLWHSTLGDLVVSLSDGSLAVLRSDISSGLQVTDTWAAHDFESWIAAWDYWDTNLLYSGGTEVERHVANP